MRENPEDYKINRLAMFSNKKMEQEYYNQDIFSSLWFIRKFVLGFGLLFLLLAFYDFIYYQQDMGKFIESAFSRGLVFVIAVLFYFLAPRFSSAKSVTNFITVFEFSMVLSYLYMLYSQNAQGFSSQALTIMLMIFGIFMFPNRWITLIITSFSIVAIFIFITPHYIEELDAYQRIETTIILLAAILVASAFFYRDNFNKRRQYAEARIRVNISITDSLTGIYNRSKFDEVLENWCGDGREEKSPFSVMLLDIDFFKQVNDTYGHLVGDEVLIRLTQVVSDNIRNRDIFARWGGEEFAILLPNQNLKGACELAERLRRVVEDTSFFPVEKVTMSVGVITYTPGDTLITVMQRVDKALYASKANGRNQVSYKEVGEKTRRYPDD